MENPYPDNVINKILQITLKTHKSAYLAVDNQGILVDQGGNIEALGLPRWEIADNILDNALFLTGFVPMSNECEYIPSLQITDSIVVDIHLFRDKDLNWAILLDKSKDHEWQSQARQKANELRLLQNKIKLQKGMNTLAKNDVYNHAFFEALNMLVLRLNKKGGFDRLEPVPDSFSEIYPEALESATNLYPQYKFPFIENFLIDAQQLWDEKINHQQISSGPWIEQVNNNVDIALEARAINWDDEKLLFIEIKDSSYQQYYDFLQRGRENVLLKNYLEHEVRKRTAEIRAREEEIVLRLICAADSRDDGETGCHIRRLGLYSELMAKHLSWHQDMIDAIRIAAPMHDIGKIGIPDNILKKRGKLTNEEFEIMKTHSQIGANILSNSKTYLLQMAYEISLGHHEKWDGSGYPNGLSGGEIPISARIVAIADVFDALIHKRVYKKRVSVDEAITIMIKGKGTHFDPKLLDLFLGLNDEMSQISANFHDPLGRNIDN